MTAEGYSWGKCARNGNLGNCSFSVQSDGAYVTYTPEGGADAVTKKLGDSADMENLQTITAYETFSITANVTTYGTITFPKVEGRKYLGIKNCGWTYAWEAPEKTFYTAVGLNDNVFSVDFHNASYNASNIRFQATAYYIDT